MFLVQKQHSPGSQRPQIPTRGDRAHRWTWCPRGGRQASTGRLDTRHLLPRGRSLYILFCLFALSLSRWGGGGEWNSQATPTSVSFLHFPWPCSWAWQPRGQAGPLWSPLVLLQGARKRRLGQRTWETGDGDGRTNGESDIISKLLYSSLFLVCGVWKAPPLPPPPRTCPRLLGTLQTSLRAPGGPSAPPHCCQHLGKAAQTWLGGVVEVGVQPVGVQRSLTDLPQLRGQATWLVGVSGGQAAGSSSPWVPATCSVCCTDQKQDEAAISPN